ncbi:MFS transporter [Henriciella barbarensis]|uniref:MFS transporter n=1 Tax=Henriciella barbarensis TaxID=86342 RepID=A0A399R0B8_9PROT|nr:MFS transporter [Henriciella barbarensis]RIJ24373.1 MFS transporter [Henriciella barbarensis]
MRLPALSENKPLRLGSLMMLYAAQGAPEGLLYIAIPAWFAAQGVGADNIAGYIAVILLPWSFKLFNGILMDRVTWSPMGRKRPWLILAQLILIGSLVWFAGLGEPTEALYWFAAAGFAVNFAGAFQDVAIDGMAIDILGEEERATANGLMWGGKTLGTAGFAFLTGRLISDEGHALAAIVTAIFVAIVMLLPLLLRERAGEKLMPWSEGQASTHTQSVQVQRWRPLVAGVFNAMKRPASLALAAGILVAFLAYGLKTAFSPTLAVEELEWGRGLFTDRDATADLLGGLFGVFVSGWLADKIGPLRALGGALIGMAFLNAVAIFLWQAEGFYFAYLLLYSVLFVLMSVCTYAIAMGQSRGSVAATQFSIFMALLNFGTSIGAGQLAWLRGAGGYEAAFAACAMLSAAALGFYVISVRLNKMLETSSILSDQEMRL